MNSICAKHRKYNIGVCGCLVFILALLFGIIQTGHAQSPGVHTRIQLQNQLAETQKGGKLLYISFLPGQENTELLIAAKQRYHLQTAVFWMSRGEGMRNYNGPETGIDLGVIHVAEMENAAKKAGFTAFVSSCKDLGARDTAGINATLATDRLIIDLASVIRQYRPDILIIGQQKQTAVALDARGFITWMDSIAEVACRVAAGQLEAQLDNPSLSPFTVHYRLADPAMALVSGDAPQESAVAELPVQAADSNVVRLNLQGEDPLTGLSFRQMAINSQLAYRSMYPDSLLNNGGLLLPHYEAGLRDTLGNASANPLGVTRVAGLKVQPGEQAAYLQAFLDDHLLKGPGKESLKGQGTIGIWSRLAQTVRQRASDSYNIDSLLRLQQAIARLGSVIQSGVNDSLITPLLTACRQQVKQLRNNRSLFLNPARQQPSDLVSVSAPGPDMLWIALQLQGIERTLMGLSIQATADQPYGILGQDFHLTIRTGSKPQKQSPHLLWLQVPGLIDTVDVHPVGQLRYKGKQQVVLDSSFHLALLQEAYQPFWLNKSLRSDGSYQIDPFMQGRLSDTTSYHVRARVLYLGDTLDYELPVMYRYFDRMSGRQVRPFYTKEPLQLTLTPTVVLTSVLRNHQRTDQKFLHFNIQTLFNDTTQVALFKIKQVGLQAFINGQKISSDTSSMIYQEAQLITPKAGERHTLSTLLSQNTIKQLNPLTPILKPTVLLKLPDGVQAFSSNIKTVGYPYQPARIYNYHSQTIVIKDTIHTTGSHLLYVNGRDGDVFENAFNQLGYSVQSAGFSQLAGWLDEVDLSSGFIPSAIKDSLQKLDCIVLSGMGERLPTDIESLNRLKYLFSAYVKTGGRLINLDPDRALQSVLPISAELYPGMLIAGIGPVKQMEVALDQGCSVLNVPNKVALRFFTKWEGILSRAAIQEKIEPAKSRLSDGKTNIDRVATAFSPFWFKNETAKNAVSPLAIWKIPVQSSTGKPRPGTDGRDKGEYSVAKDNSGCLINCFLELTGPLNNGHADAYKLLANLLGYVSSTK